MRSSDPRIELLGGLSSEDLAHSLKQRLDTSSVIIRAGTTTAALAISTANVLARLVPNVSVVSASDQGVFVPPFGEGEIARIGAQVVTQARTSIPVEQSGPVVVVAVEPNRDADLYVSASAWSIRISDHPHEPLHGLGPATSAASALVAAEILRRLLPELPGVRLKDQLIEWNLLDYRLRIAPSEPPPGPVTSVCFGGGSVGSSVLYSLMLSGGAGTLTFVDPDHLSSRNKIRYPLLFSSSRALKVDWLSSLSTAQLHVAGAALSASDYISASTLPIESTIAAVDTASARRDVTDALAHETLEAGVAGLQFHVGRHRFGDGFACAYCGYVDLGNPMDEAAVFAEMTGLSIQRVGSLLAGDLLTADDMRVLEEGGRVSSAESVESVGHRLQDLIRGHLYAQARVEVGEGQFGITAPFVSLLAGAILAGELQKTGGLELWRLERRVDLDCSGYPTGFQSRPLQDRTGRCLCSDSFRLNAYNQMWAVK